MDDQNILNIPAYQRKRSIMAKARRQNLLKTEQQKPAKTLKTKKPIRTTRRSRPISTPATYIQDDNYSYIPVNNSPTIEDLFPEALEIKNTSNTFPREMKICGICEGYFDKIDVAIVKVMSPIRTGDTLILTMNEGLFEQPIDSMQIDRKNINLAKSGNEIGLKIRLKPIVGTNVYKVVES